MNIKEDTEMVRQRDNGASLADSRPNGSPVGAMRKGFDLNALVAAARPVEPEGPSAIAVAAAKIDAEDEQKGLKVGCDDPHRLARLHVQYAHHHPKRPKILFQGGRFLTWDRNVWRETTDDIEGALTRTARAEFERENKGKTASRAAIPPGASDGTRAPTVRKIGRTLIGNIRLALASIVGVPGDLDTPRWLGGHSRWEPRDIVPFPNGLLNLSLLATGTAKHWKAPTPNFFSRRCLDFPYDAEAGRPEGWLAFLRQVTGDDQESMDLLQEWFGYCLTEDTVQQKILMIIGPTRSGKGTIGRVLGGLLGAGNVAGPGFASLATNFGAAPLIGKSVAVIGDARLSGRTDQAIIVERLLSISGEDRITADRKHRDAWDGKLSTRLVLLTNEIPEFRDASLALANRLLILELNKSFLGREDPQLTAGLLRELPGIFHWAVEGWKRLRERGKFLSPKRSLSIMESMKDLSSPVAAFVKTRCWVAPGGRVRAQELREAYLNWCASEGIRHPATEAQFGKQLVAAILGVKNRRLKFSSGAKVSCYCGLELRDRALPGQQTMPFEEDDRDDGV